MAFYDASQSSTQLSPLQRGLLLPPDAILSHQDLLAAICSEANFSDEKAEYILDILIKNIKDNISYNNISQSTTSLYILDYCIRNGTIFGQYVFGRYILQKLYTLCCKKLTQVSSNHKSHQQFQYQLIGTILEWHRMYSNQPGSTLNYTFSRLQKSGILALYQSYKQTQNLYNQNNAKSQQLQNNNYLQNKSESPPNLPPSPQPPQVLPPHDEKQLISILILQTLLFYIKSRAF